MVYNDPSIAFGRNYIIPKPLDTRLISRIAPAVAKAAIESGERRTESRTGMPTGINWKNVWAKTNDSCAE